MSIKFCLVPKEDLSPQNSGSRYVFDHKSSWVDASDFGSFLTVGYVKGVDYVHYQDKTYMLMKTFIDISTKTVVILAEESISGCDL